MKLLNLKLTKFRQHQESQFDFQDGLLGIIGNNGSGKSTLIEAIAFALYGSRALRGPNKDDVVTYGSNKKDCAVKLSFEHNNQVFRIDRNLSDAKIYFAGEADPLVSGNTAVSNHVQEILGLNLEEFLASYYTEQKSLEFLSNKKGAAERERFVARMIGYDRLEKIQELVKVDIKDQKNIILGIKAGLGDRSDLEKAVEQQTAELNTLKLEQETKVAALEEAVRTEKSLKVQFDKLSARSKEYLELKQTIQQQQQQVLAFQKRQEQQEVRIQELNLLIETSTAEFTKVQKSKIANLLPELEQEFVELDKTSQSIQTQITSYERELAKEQQQVQSEHDMTLGQVQLKAKRIKDFEKLKDNQSCPTCGQKITEQTAELQNELAGQLQDQEAKLADLKKILNQFNQDTPELEEQKKELQAKQKEGQVLQSKITQLRNIQKELVEYELLDKELASGVSAMQSMQEAVSASEQKLQKLAFDEQHYTALRVQYESAVSLAQTARLNRTKIEEQVKAAKDLLKRDQEDLIKYDQKATELKSRQIALIDLEETSQVLTDFRKYLNVNIRPRLSELASDYLAELSDGRYTSLEIKEDFSPQVYENSYLKTVLSGGEEDMINLCLRLALSSMIAERAGQSLSFLILDEVFGSLDESRRLNVLNLLERLQNRFEQIILITHLDDIKEGVNHILYINYDESSDQMTFETGTRYFQEVNI